MFQVKDIMTEDVFTLRETDTLITARDLMNLLRIRHIPVVDDHGRFLGLVTHRDILAATVSKLADMAAAAHKEIEAAIPVFEIMQREVTTIAEDTSLEEALRVLLRGKFGCLPVLRHGKLCGILSEADFLRLTLQLLETADIDEGPISRKSLGPLHNRTAMPTIHPVIQNALEALFAGAPISPGTALAISALPEVETPGLLLAARTVRRATRGSTVHRCMILNAKSGRCSEDCAFCAQSGHYATAAPVTPLLNEETIVAAGEAAAQAGAHCFSIVTSGLRLTSAELATVCGAVARLRQRTNLELAASLGLLSDADAAQLRAAGLTRYHHNLETSASYFPRICSTHRYAEDVATVRRAKAHGLEVCCGGIIGLGEGWAERIELALTLRELEVERIPLNFLLPIPGTPLEAQPLLSPHDALKTIALFRLLLPQAGITIAGGRSRILGDYQSWIFLAGADGCMIGNYLTTPGRDLAADAVMLEAGTWI